MRKFLITCLATLFYTTVFSASTTHPIADALGWQPNLSKNKTCSLCSGHYIEPMIVANTPNPAPYQTVPITITAKGPVIFRANGTSVMQGDVQIHQPGRLVLADNAVIYHNQKTGKITKIILTGHVHVQEHGQLLIGKKVVFDVAKNTLLINNSLYRIVGQHEMGNFTTSFDAWGSAKKMQRDANGNMTLEQATYSTCPPIKPSWIMSAKTLTLNHVKGEGYARDIVLRFKNVPIFYSPYYSFSLNNNRKSGFLPPSFGDQTNQGFYFSQPYYWNIAPNYDLLFTPEWYTLRGLQLNNNFRYLTDHSDGNFYISYMPNDPEFGLYKRTTLSQYANTPITPQLAPYLSNLQNQNNARAFFDFQNDVQFNKRLSGKFYARYATDPYFSENFQSSFLQQNSNQLPSFAEVSYSGLHWNNKLLLQSYQTLHPIDQYLTPAQNQYTRLPEFDFNAAYPSFLPKTDFNLSTQAVNFDYESNYYPFTYQRPIGARVHLQPSISTPFEWSDGFITPKITADNTDYFSQLQTTSPNSIRQQYDAGRTLPIIDMDSGLYLDRSVDFAHTQYIQTLEPRIFYLYTPYLDQDKYPNFDTQLLPFTTNDLYALNAYTGFDRLQNANQVSFGLTSRLVNADTANNILTAELGLIDYFDTPRVCLLPGCQIVSRSISPITGSLIWNPNSFWSINTNAAWDTILNQINNAQIGAQYNISSHRLILLNYLFTHGNSNTPFDASGISPDASLLTTGLVWPLIKRWNFFGYEYYDLTHGRSQSQYVGLAYDTCCWALRFIVSSNYNGTISINNGAIQQNQYSTNYYFQFLLKGLGSIGNGDAESLLGNTLPDFQDSFSNHGHYLYGTTDSGF